MHAKPLIHSKTSLTGTRDGKFVDHACHITKHAQLRHQAIAYKHLGIAHRMKWARHEAVNCRSYTHWFCKAIYDLNAFNIRQYIDGIGCSDGGSKAHSTRTRCYGGGTGSLL
ncbi:hypothetical protein DCAR_0313005 [Daucus carota subsp. sativus]|uniref:Uncharacterized protein n=1 Tax=Daucus carota subsp. sativus TaxID=79200 RepID=A0A166BQG0_DAUCS|nr:hypothetical protein DCAR_0313005 [Daucus carota subsp. sativus]